MGFSSPPFQTTRAFKAAQFGSKFLLPAGVRIAVLGSSSVARNTSVSSNVIAGQGYGAFICARQRDPRFDFTNYYNTGDTRGWSGANYGFGGQNNAYMMPFMADIIAKGYGAVVLQMSQNDIPDLIRPVSSIINQVRTTAIQARNAGLGVYLVTLNPRSPVGASNQASVVPVGSPIYRRHIAYNDLLSDLAQELGVELIDTRFALTDPNSSVRAAKPGYSEDGLHLTALGAWATSGVIEAVFRRTILGGSGHILDATAPGNLFSNGLLTGTGGALAGTQNSTPAPAQSGTLPDKVRVGASGNLPFVGTCACSIVSDPEQGNAIRQVYSVTGADGSVPWRTWFSDNPASSGNPVVASLVGQWVRTYRRIYIESGGELIQNLTANALSFGGTVFTVIEGNSAIGVGDPVGDTTLNNRELWLITEPFLVPAGATGVAMNVEVWMGGTGTTVLEISRPALRVVSAPLP